MSEVLNADLRVIIAAENASFKFGGEASLPLHYFSRLRERGIEAWLVVHGRTRPELDVLFPCDRDRILTIPDSWVHKLLWKPHAFLPRRVYGPTFGLAMELYNQMLKRKLVKGLVRKKRANVVHQPTPVSPKTPSSLANLGVAVVIGPMNGGMEYPSAFCGSESSFTRVFVSLARNSANVFNRLVPGKRDAEILLVANARTRNALPSCAGGEIIEMPENGVDLRIWRDREHADEGTVNHKSCFIFVGRLIDWKRLDFVLRAMVRVPACSLEVIGDGEMRAEWSALAQRLGIAERVKFVGWLPQTEIAARLRTGVALLLPSIYECGGAVVLEAMATGTPVIATDWGGPADYLDPASGFLVSATNEETIIDGFASAMQTLLASEGTLVRMGQSGRRKVEAHYDWERKVDRMLETYRRAILLRAQRS